MRGFAQIGVDDDTNNDVYFILSDHLGSTSVTLNNDGTVKSEMRYTAFGEVRHSSGSAPTDKGYTGQREEADIGLYFYNARWYDPALGRFAQADSFVPHRQHPGSYDRYAYVLNNPLRNTDPSGHFETDQIKTLFDTDEEYDFWMAIFGAEGSIYADIYHILNNAEFGDIFAYYDAEGQLHYYMFVQGENGQILLYDIHTKEIVEGKKVIEILIYAITMSEGWAWFSPQSTSSWGGLYNKPRSRGTEIESPVFEEGWNRKDNGDGTITVIDTVDTDELLLDLTIVMLSGAVCFPPGAQAIGCTIAVLKAFDMLDEDYSAAIPRISTSPSYSYAANSYYYNNTPPSNTSNYYGW